MFERHPTLIPGRQRLSVFIGLIMLCLVLTQFIQLPTRTFAVNIFGSELGIDLSTDWLMAVLLASLACTGTDALVRTHPRAQELGLPYTFVYWILPGLLGLAAARLLSQAPTRSIWVAGLVASGVLFAVLLTAEYTTVDPLAPVYPQAKPGHSDGSARRIVCPRARFAVECRSTTRSHYHVGIRGGTGRR
jgi:hypothetical protein